ncbi:radical SAM protein [Streptomyces sp. NBC_01476]|uniref:radical SAM protein n=1 Tax=Streptomyces sp. NBC_01476 TaxID=2903881 RepID=UPI002E344F6E|nr:radical SAM protein [Streptomyces sp. NBC_01476]
MKQPFKLWFELESRCNLRCPFCFNHWKSGASVAPARSPVEKLKKSITTLLEVIDCTQVALSGGEPLLNPELPAWVDFFARKNIPSILTTNGFLLSQEKATLLSGLGLGAVQIPVLSGDRALHDKLSGRPCWEQTIRALVASRTAGLPVSIVFVATRENLGSLPGVLSMARTLGIRRIIFNRFIASGAGVINAPALQVTDEEVVSALESSKIELYVGEVEISLGVPLELSRPSPILRTMRPSEHTAQITVDASGAVKRCNQAVSSLSLATPGLTRATILEALGQPLKSGECYCADKRLEK